MSNFHVITEKKKMENIAMKLLNSNQKWKNNNISISIKNSLKGNNIEPKIDSKETEKDILTLVNSKRREKSERNQNKININKNFFSVKEVDYENIKEEGKENARKQSQIPKKKIARNKEVEIVPKIKGLEKVAKNYIDKLNKNNSEESSSNTNTCTIENSSETLDDYINFDILKHTYTIYEELKKQFYSIQNLNNSIDGGKIKKDIYFKCKVLAHDYIQFLFGEEIQKIIKLFNYCLDIGKFIIYQIYLFLSIIYLDDNKKIDDSIEMSYKTILLYSSQNFNLILNLIENPQYCSDPKKIIGIKTKNKIIISVLKLINPNIPTNSQIKEFINPSNNKMEIDDERDKIGKFPLKCLEEIGKNKNNENRNYSNYNNNKQKGEDKERYNSLGIINLLQLLKQNKELKERLEEIKKKVFDLCEQKSNSISNNNTFENNNVLANLNNNQMVNNNFITSSLSSLNNNSRSNNNSSTKNRLSYINKLLLPQLKSDNYKFYLIFELDETLVHYWEEKDNCFVKVRCGVEDCFNIISEFCEITIVSTSSKEYTDIVVDNINKKKSYIQNRIYKELFDEDGIFDLSCINRDMKKCIFICHEEEFFNAPKNNILKLTEFTGDESDREMVFFCKELQRMKNTDISDVTQIIPEMSNNIII